MLVDPANGRVEVQTDGIAVPLQGMVTRTILFDYFLQGHFTGDHSFAHLVAAKRIALGEIRAE